MKGKLIPDSAADVVYKDGRPQGIIDFDMAGPGPRMWDIAYVLYTSVPLANFSPEMDGKGVMPYVSQAHGTIRKNGLPYSWQLRAECSSRFEGLGHITYPFHV